MSQTLKGGLPVCTQTGGTCKTTFIEHHINQLKKKTVDIGLYQYKLPGHQYHIEMQENECKLVWVM